MTAVSSGSRSDHQVAASGSTVEVNSDDPPNASLLDVESIIAEAASSGLYATLSPMIALQLCCSIRTDAATSKALEGRAASKGEVGAINGGSVADEGEAVAGEAPASEGPPTISATSLMRGRKDTRGERGSGGVGQGSSSCSTPTIPLAHCLRPGGVFSEYRVGSLSAAESAKCGGSVAEQWSRGLGSPRAGEMSPVVPMSPLPITKDGLIVDRTSEAHRRLARPKRTKGGKRQPTKRDQRQELRGEPSTLLLGAPHQDAMDGSPRSPRRTVVDASRITFEASWDALRTLVSSVKQGSSNKPGAIAGLNSLRHKLPRLARIVDEYPEAVVVTNLGASRETNTRARAARLYRHFCEASGAKPLRSYTKFLVDNGGSDDVDLTRIGAVGQKSVAPVVQSLRVLHPRPVRVKLPNAGVTDDIVVILCDVVKTRLPHLQELDLSNNHYIGRQGGMALQRLCQEHHCIVAVNLEGTSVSHSVKKAIGIHTGRNRGAVQ